MPAPFSIRTIDTHTEGMPTRIVLDGAPALPGGSMQERLTACRDQMNELREFLVREPRGHAAMFGAILMPAIRDDADHGVIFFSSSGFLGMCGHGTIAVATVLVERGLVVVTEPVTEVRLDTPAGLVVASVQVEDGKSRSVTFTNVPSFVLAQDERIELPGIEPVRVDVAYGGNFYAMFDPTPLGIDLDPANLEKLMDLGLALIRVVRDQVPIAHPTRPGPAELRAAILVRPPTANRPARNIMVKEPRYFDRSPCGTGTSARMAVAYRAGQLRLNETFLHESILGTLFEGKLTAAIDLGGIPAVIPQITGRAWITGTAEYMLDPTDPFPTGFGF